jgi:hypothetical protein
MKRNVSLNGHRIALGSVCLLVCDLRVIKF